MICFYPADFTFVCPAGWRPGKKTLPVNTDAEKMTGRVGDYITLDEVLIYCICCDFICFTGTLKQVPVPEEYVKTLLKDRLSHML